MAREIQTFTWCDVCLENEERTDAIEVSVQMDALKPRVIAMCEPHRKQFIDPLRDLLIEHGQTTNSPSSTSASPVPGGGGGQFGLFECGMCDKGPYAHKQSLRSHIRATHNMTVTEYRAELARRGVEQDHTAVTPSATPEPAEDTETLFYNVDEPVEKFTCEVCGKQYPPGQYARPAQAIGMHRAKAHGIRGTKHERRQAERAALKGE